MTSLSRRLMGGWSELHVAASEGDLARVRRRVDKHPDEVDKANKERQTPLHLAAAGGFEAVAGELLERRARATAQDEAGRTPLHLAAERGHSRVIAALLGHHNKEGAAERARLLGMKDNMGRDALGAAVVGGQAAAVEALLAAGVDAARSALPEEGGAGLIHSAVRLGHIHLLPLLAPACGLGQRHPATGGTPLHAAAAAGRLTAVEWLVRAGASTTTRDNAGRTAAEAATAAGQFEAVKAIRGVMTAAAAGSGGGGAAGAAAPYDHRLLQPAAGAGPGGSGGGATGGAGSGGGGYGYGAPPLTVTPWQYGGAPPLAVPAGMAPPPAGPGPWPGPQSPTGSERPPPQLGGRLQIPDQPPQPVYYPKPPPGAGVYY